LRRQDDLREGPELSRTARDDGAVRSVERTGGAVRPSGVEPERVAHPHPPHARRAGGRSTRLDQERNAEAAHRPRSAARAGGGGAPAARGTEDHGESVADSLTSRRGGLSV